MALGEGFLGGVLNGGTISTAFNTIIFIAIGIVIVALILVGLYFYRRNVIAYNQFKCVIFRKDTFGQIHQKFDSAGIFVDKKTNNKRLFLKKSQVGLNADSIPYIQTTKGDTIYLYQVGEKNFRYIKVNVLDPKIGFIVGEEDVNWAINAYERQKKLFSNDKLMQLLPYAGLLLISIIIMVIFIYFFKNFDVLRDVAVSLKETAVEISKASADTVVVQGGVPLP